MTQITFFYSGLHVCYLQKSVFMREMLTIKSYLGKLDMDILLCFWMDRALGG